jgi:two-component system KDP operon response regulator KdpE
MSVLIVDDDPALRKVMRILLAASGFQVEECGTGLEALRMVQLHAFDLVLLDVNMPGMGGVEVCRKIRELTPRTGILMVTVRNELEDKVLAFEAGADDYVNKPFPFQELLARMGAILRRTHAPSTTGPAA